MYNYDDDLNYFLLKINIVTRALSSNNIKYYTEKVKNTDLR